MVNTMLGTKIKMEQAFVGNARVPVTIISAAPNVITQIKNMDTDGYIAVQLGFGTKKIKNTPKPEQGHLKGVTKKNMTPRFLREVRVDGTGDFKVGDKISLSDVFVEGDRVAVTGTSKGKGFAGVVKRWGFAGGPKTHGQSDRPRSPGSIGMGGTTPGRVQKGKKMAGRMGNERVTVKNLKVVSVDLKKSEIRLSGPVPGIPGSLLMIERLSKHEQN